MSNHVTPNAAPGTGTQYYYVATPPSYMLGGDDEKPSTYRHGGQKWHVGGEYIDVEIGAVCRLDLVVRKSTWCDTSDPEDGQLLFRFRYDRLDSTEIDPNASIQDDELTAIDERFIERYDGKPQPPGDPR